MKARIAAPFVIITLAILLSAVSARAQAPAAVKYGDGTPDGKKSLGGSGEMIRFALPEGKSKVQGLRVHGSRYGSPESPKEKFLIYFLNRDGSEIVAAEMAPYSLFERGGERWVDIKFARPIEVPNPFWIALDFRAGRTKGVYVSYDTSSEGKYSRVGLPGMETGETDFRGDWMIEVLPAE